MVWSRWLDSVSNLQSHVAYLDGGGLGRAHLHDQIDALARADRDGNRLGFGDGEAGGAGGDGINPDAQRGHFIVAGLICLDHRGDAGGIIGDGHRHVRNDGAAGVMNGSDHAACVVLGKSRARRKHQQKRHGQKGPAESKNSCLCRAGCSGVVSHRWNYRMHIASQCFCFNSG